MFQQQCKQCGAGGVAATEKIGVLSGYFTEKEEQRHVHILMPAIRANAKALFRSGIYATYEDAEKCAVSAFFNMKPVDTVVSEDCEQLYQQVIRLFNAYQPG